MSSSEPLNSPQPNTDQQDTPTAGGIETVYTTVESQADRTDWLTVVSNLRQINRQLVEQIARLEQALASTKQNLHDRQEANQNHEITILQQQDELKMARDRVGALFQQLENSHQIGQRQQTLIETISQQLEIAQAIILQLEAENERLDRNYQQQTQKLVKAEQVIAELYQQLKERGSADTDAAPIPEYLAPDNNPTDVDRHEISIDPTIENRSIASTLLITSPKPPSNEKSVKLPNLSTPEPNILDVFMVDEEDEEDEFEDDESIAETDKGTLATRTTSIDLPDEEIPIWTPSDERLAQKIDPAPPKSSPQTSWREALAKERIENIGVDREFSLDFKPTPAEAAAIASTDEEDAIEDKPSPNWPAPTVSRPRPENQVAKKIDLPKFPKKQQS
jgi:hypothetical protein